MFTKATVHYTGRVEWEPPAIYKSYCAMNIEWFPFDEQVCNMKFGFWSYDGDQTNLVHWRGTDVNITKDDRGLTIWVVDMALDLSGYYPSVEWEIIAAPAVRHSVVYPCCEAPFIDVTYTLHIRRKTLFYTVNLVLPCVGISYLTILVFYLPSDSQEKITLCTSILLALKVFFLLLAETVPATSLVIPLIGKYLIFTMGLVTGSVATTIATMNVYYNCKSQTVPPRMSQWIRLWFLSRIPRLLLMKRFKVYEWRPRGVTHTLLKVANNMQFTMQKYAKVADPAELAELEQEMKEAMEMGENDVPDAADNEEPKYKSKLTFDDVKKAKFGHEMKVKMERVASCVNYIVQRLHEQTYEKEMKEEWRYVATVIDKLLLYFYVTVCIVCTGVIVLRAPRIRDYRDPLA